jgi:spore germination protein GerM
VIGKKTKAKSGPSVKTPGFRGKVSSGRGKPGNRGAVYIFWLFFFVLIICLFIVNLDAIQTSLRNTGIIDRLLNRPSREQDAPPPGLNDGDGSPVGLPSPAPFSGRDGGASESEPSTESREPEPESPVSPAVPSAETPDGQTVPPAGLRESGGQERPPVQTAPAVPPVQTPAGQTPAVPREEDGQSAARTTPQNPPENRRERVLYFMQVDPEGIIIRTKVNRSLPVTDSPLTQVLTTLLQGPSAEETRRGLITLIPKGTRLLSVEVKDPTAYINFNETFLFNEFGVEGYAGQLRQLVWTVTEFTNIKDVQVLVEGRRLDYLGESIWIGSPVGRESR